MTPAPPIRLLRRLLLPTLLAAVLLAHCSSPPTDTNQAYERGWRAFERGAYPEAAELFERAYLLGASREGSWQNTMALWAARASERAGRPTAFCRWLTLAVDGEGKPLDAQLAAQAPAGCALPAPPAATPVPPAPEAGPAPSTEPVRPAPEPPTCPAGKEPIEVTEWHCCLPGQRWIEGACSGAPRPVSGPWGIEWVPLEGGSFSMGSKDGAADEKPLHQVELKPFLLMKTEVTVQMYQACVDEGKCSTHHLTGYEWPAGGGWTAQAFEESPYCNFGKQDQASHPMNCLDWTQAKAFCEAAGGRLPSEAEWEYAARGKEGRRYPWGETNPGKESGPLGNFADLAAKKLWTDWEIIDGYDDRHSATAPVGSFAAGATPEGLQDMTGNVWEWVGDCYVDSYRGAPVDGTARDKANCAFRVIRGGGFFSSLSLLRAALRFRYSPAYRLLELGLRCAR